MEKFIIKGGTPLRGEVRISGAKNAAVAIIPAAILAEDKCILENVPSISDVDVALEILSSMGAQIRRLSKWIRQESRTERYLMSLHAPQEEAVIF